MKKKLGIIIGVLVVLLGVTGFFVYKAIFLQKPPVTVAEEVVETLPQVDASVVVAVKKSSVKADAIVLSVSGMAGKTNGIEYDVSYETKGQVQGVTSGIKPIDVTGKDSFEREIYLGTCSKNVCTPHAGVTKVSIDLRFTDAAEKKSTFSKEFEL
jgi:hypothetical protein